MDLRPQDLSRAKAVLKMKAFAGTIVLHTSIWLAGFYSDQLYLFMANLCMIMFLVTWMEARKAKLAQHVKGLYLGTIPASHAFFMPKNHLLSISAQFMVLNYGFHELTWHHLPYLFGGNILSWAACVLYCKFQTSNDPEVLFLKNFLEDSNQWTQVLMGFVLHYTSLIVQTADKYMNIKTQKQYEEKLLQLNADLEETNKKLKKSNEELQEALQEKENFILRFSHEIRNPLNSLLGNIELCYEQAMDKDLEQMLKDAKVSGEILLQLLNNVLDTAKVAVGRLEVSINHQNVRTFLERAWIICSEIIRKKKLQGSLSVNANVPEVLEFDHHRMMQILINMISNAAKFTDRGQVKVHVDFIRGSEIKKEDMLPKHRLFEVPETLFSLDSQEDLNETPKTSVDILTLTNKRFQLEGKSFLKSQCENTIEVPFVSKDPFFRRTETDLSSMKADNPSSRVFQYRNTIREEPKEGFIRFEIVDTGCGIPKRSLENLFKKFQQVDVNTSKRQIGTGLGLWITKEIIEMMNGKVEIFSEPNKGTVIVIMVKSKSKPANTMQVDQSNGKRHLFSHKPSTVVSKPPNMLRVLIVEDIAYNQEINRKFFQKCGVEDIAIASNGQEGVDLFLEMGPKYFDLITMDIDMPIMDGKTAVKIIRQEEKKRGLDPVKIFFLTGFSEAKTQKEVLDEKGDYRANGFFSKPASLDTFKNILKEIAATPESQGQPGKGPHKFRSENVVPPDQFVLVVDDDSFNITLLTKTLKLCGINTLEARNGLEAMEVFDVNWKNIYCVLMDCEMPVMDGLAATELIIKKHRQRAALSGKKIEIYGLTGHVGQEYKEKCLGAGMVGVFEKPINIEALIEKFQKNSEF